MKIGLAQINCYPDDVEENCFKIDQYLERAKDEGCELAAFPELADTGYDPASISQNASAWDQLPMRTIQGAAKDLGIHVICGLSEKEGEAIYNSLAVVNPEGSLIGKYRKTHLFKDSDVDESQHFTPGDSLPPILDIGNMKWGCMICYDLRFPELSRILAIQGAEVLVYCSAWPMARISRWEILLQARAIENQAYVLGVNRSGSDGPVTFGGASMIVDPAGIIIAKAQQDKEALLTADLDPEILGSTRKAMEVFKHRRPGIYKLNGNN